MIIADSLWLREADFSCSSFVFESRNDELARAMSPGGSFTFDQHEEWFKDALVSDNVLLFVVSLCAEDIGVVRFQRESDDCRYNGTYTVSINLHINHRGKNLAPHVLALGLKALQTRIPLSLTVAAYVKRENLSSLATFAKCGFTEEVKPLDTSAGSTSEIVKLVRRLPS